MSVRRSRLCALILTLAMLPGIFELFENSVHLIAEGHLAHVEAEGHDHRPTGPEHGCTPTAHVCGCHTSLVFLGTAAAAKIHLGTAAFRGQRLLDPLSTGFLPSIDRPPRA